MGVKNPPEGYHVVTPGLNVDGAAAAIDFYKRAFGAEERSRMPGPGGKIMHSEILIGDSIIMISDTFPEMGNGPTSSTMWIYTADCDALHRRAVGAGAKGLMEPADMFWGDRMGMVADAWGNKWGIATRVKDLSEAELRAAGEAFQKQHASAPPSRG